MIDSVPKVNQLNTRSGAGPFAIRFMGKVNEPAVVSVNGQEAAMAQDPNSPSNGKIFSKTLTLPAGNNAVSVVAEDFGTTGNGPNGGNTTTKNYTVTVAGGQDKTFSYDDNGNCISVTTADKAVVYQWDAEDRLVKITQTPVSGPVLESEFTYDGFSRRVGIEEKTNGVSGSVKRFIWCGTKVCEERDAANNVTKRFFEEGEQIGATPFYFTKDHLGSIRELVGQGGAVRARYDYDPYGRRTQVSGPRESDFGFTGHYYHAPSGLHLAMYRAYDADIGRWINRDPIGEDGGLNLYEYVSNSPITWIDPYGLDNMVPGGENAPPAITITYDPSDPGNPTVTWPDLDTLSLLGLGMTFGAYESSKLGAEYYLGGAIGNGIGKLARCERLFGRGGAGLLNDNPILRIGWGWKGTAKSGHEVFRIAWGPKGSWWHGHLDVWPLW